MNAIELPAELDRRKNIPSHQFADIFPLIDDESFDDLVSDIKAHGLRESVILHEGAILDGRNRYRACNLAGVDCRFEIYKGDDALAFAISKNLKRRHLSESQRAMVAAKLANMPRGGDRREQSANLHSASKTAEMLNVSERSVKTAKAVQERGSPALVSAVEKGKVSVSAAAEVAQLPEEEQAEIVAKGEKEIVAAASRVRREKKGKRKRTRGRRFDHEAHAESPHDRDLRMLLGVWEAACESARAAFLEAVNQ